MNWFLVIPSLIHIGVVWAMYSTDPKDFIDSILWRNEWAGSLAPWVAMFSGICAVVGIIIEIVK